MGVVHLARRDDGHRVALKVLRPHIVGDDEARARLAREVSSLSPDPQPVGRRDRRRRPVGRRSRTSPPATSPGCRCTSTWSEEGPIAGDDLLWFARVPRRGARLRPRGRRAAPRREAVERADGGSDPDPDRLRAGPGRRRPEAHPHRLAAGHAGLPRARDPVRRRRDRRPPTCTPGRRPSRSPAPGTHRSAAARRWRSWTGSGAASTTSPGCPTTCARSSTRRSTPTRLAARRSTGSATGCAAAARCRSRPSRRRPRRATTRSRCRWRSPATAADDATDVSFFDDDEGDDGGGGTRFLDEDLPAPRADVRRAHPPRRCCSPAWRLARRGRGRGLPVAGARACSRCSPGCCRSASLAASAAGDRRPAPRDEVVRRPAAADRLALARGAGRSPARCCSCCGASASALACGLICYAVAAGDR